MNRAQITPGVKKTAPRRWSPFVSRWEYSVGGEDFFVEDEFKTQWEAAQTALYLAEQARTLERVFAAFQRSF